MTETKQFNLFLLVVVLILLFIIVYPNFEADIRNPFARAESEMNGMTAALDSFFIDNNAYPDSPASRLISEASMINAQSKNCFLTTPVAYIGFMPFDPFSGDGASDYCRYYSDGKTWYVLAGNGPDRDIDLIEESYPEPFNEATIRFDHPGHFMFQFCYSPSNGLNSNGDIIRIGNYKKKGL